MMEAVARGKAHWLFDKQEKSSVRRPQEDLVTSAVFGSIRFLPSEDRQKAVDLLIGNDCLKAADFGSDSDTAIELWPQKLKSETGNRVEPDVLLIRDHKTVIVEVKWHASWVERQIKDQIEAVKEKGHKVMATMVLGKAGTVDIIDEIKCFKRTWRDVSNDLDTKLRQRKTYKPFEEWMRNLMDFLQKTSVGRIFTHLPSPPEDQSEIFFSFSKPGHTPWLDAGIEPVTLVRFQFEGT